MGITLWLASGAAAFALARIVPLARQKRWLGELLVSISTALALGTLATALDFGGWQEPDWRAGAFGFFGAVAVVGGARLLRSGGPD